MPSGATMQIRWLQAALRDLDAEVAYVAERDEEAAVRMYALIRERVARLAQIPDMERAGRVFGTRERDIHVGHHHSSHGSSYPSLKKF